MTVPLLAAKAASDHTQNLSSKDLDRSISDRAPRVGFAFRLRRVLSALVPYWNRGAINAFRIRGDEQIKAEGQVGFVEIQWLGLHLEVQLGRAP